MVGWISRPLSFFSESLIFLLTTDSCIVKLLQMADDDKLTPEQVLVNCMGEADRIQDLLILVYTKDGFYEHWSNNLPSHIRLGLIEIGASRIRKTISETEEQA